MRELPSRVQSASKIAVLSTNTFLGALREGESGRNNFFSFSQKKNKIVAVAAAAAAAASPAKKLWKKIGERKKKKKNVDLGRRKERGENKLVV